MSKMYKNVFFLIGKLEPPNKNSRKGATCSAGSGTHGQKPPNRPARNNWEI